MNNFCRFYILHSYDEKGRPFPFNANWNALNLEISSFSIAYVRSSEVAHLTMTSQRDKSKNIAIKRCYRVKRLLEVNKKMSLPNNSFTRASCERSEITAAVSQLTFNAWAWLGCRVGPLKLFCFIKINIFGYETANLVVSSSVFMCTWHMLSIQQLVPVRKLLYTSSKILYGQSNEVHLHRRSLALRSDISIGMFTDRLSYSSPQNASDPPKQKIETKRSKLSGVSTSLPSWRVPVLLR